MPEPTAGQPFFASPGLRISIGDSDALAGTDAYAGVIVTEAGAPSPYIVDSTAPFDLTVYIKRALGGVGFALPATFSVEFHIHGLDGVPVAGSPFAGGAIVDPDTPAGASAPVGLDVVEWASSTVPIPAGTLTPGTTYRITTHGHDAAGAVMAFHDGTIIHTED